MSEDSRDIDDSDEKLAHALADCERAKLQAKVDGIKLAVLRKHCQEILDKLDFSSEADVINLKVTIRECSMTEQEHDERGNKIAQKVEKVKEDFCRLTGNK
jgi:hypothetical protein